MCSRISSSEELSSSSFLAKDADDPDYCAKVRAFESHRRDEDEAGDEDEDDGKWGFMELWGGMVGWLAWLAGTGSATDDGDDERVLTWGIDGQL
eukprot:COSAG05_NODE_288_length_12074_cov_119.196827_6_plen_94_part_00